VTRALVMLALVLGGCATRTIELLGDEDAGGELDAGVRTMDVDTCDLRNPRAICPADLAFCCTDGADFFCAEADLSDGPIACGGP
jgi:hypothetical protein